MIIDILIPQASESVTEADIASWMKADGDMVAMDEAICELETDKASMELTAPAAGKLKILVEEYSTATVGSLIAQIDTEATGPAPAAEKTAAPAAEKTAAPAAESAPVAAAEEEKTQVSSIEEVMNEKIPSPAAKKLIIENGISAQDIPASGKGGRLTKADVMNYLSLLKKEQSIHTPAAKAPAAKATPAAKAPASTVTPDDQGRAISVQRMSRLRRTVAERLCEAQKTAAILTTFNEVDMKPIMDLRKKYKDMFKKKYEVNLGFMSFFAKATCMALKEFPIMNAQVDGNNIVFHDFADIGVAVSTPKGLVVPVIRDADQMNFREIESKILELAIKGRNADLTPDEMTGGTFTITNGGTFGSMLSTPILNRPQSAILGMHNIVQRPVVVDGEIVIRPIMYLAVSYDHRIIDGSDAVRFLVKIKECLEDPTRILLEI